MLLAARFADVCSLHASKTCMQYKSHAWTYADVSRDVAQLSGELHKAFKRRTIGSGNTDVLLDSPIPVLIRGSPPFVMKSILATWNVGAIAVPIGLTMTQREQKYLMQDSLSQWLLEEGGASSDKGVVHFISEHSDRDRNTVCSPETQAHMCGRCDDALLLYTSGTTALPKGVVHTSASLQSQVDMLHHAWRWSHEDVISNHLPLHHIHGLVNVALCALLCGATIQFQDAFRAIETLELLRTGSSTLFMSVPTVYASLCRAYAQRFNTMELQKSWIEAVTPRMRLFVSGSSALPTPILVSFEKIAHKRILERYGMTETGMVLSQPYSPESARIPGTVGNVLPGVSVAVAEDDTLLVRSPGLFSRYWNRPPEVTQSVFDGDGYFKTRDVVALGSESSHDTTAHSSCDEREVSAARLPNAFHSFRILGRENIDIMKVHGYKVSALEIEAVLLQISPLISEVCVFPRRYGKDPPVLRATRGLVANTADDGSDTIIAVLTVSNPRSCRTAESHRAIVETEDLTSPNRDALHVQPAIPISVDVVHAHCIKELSSFMRPQEIWIRNEALPRNAMGKVNKNIVRELYFSHVEATSVIS